jgi:SAM-dependent methyltransferase
VDFLDPAAAFEKGESPSRQVRVLDYACGPGTITSILQGHATEFIGVDLSANMVKTYNEKFAESNQQSGTVTQKAQAFVGDLLDSRGPSESISGSGFFDFDLAVVGYGFHHFEDLDIATSRLASRLKPGGVLLIVDFVTHARLEGGDPNDHIIAHHGFGEKEVRSLLGRAGLVDVGVLEMEGAIEMKKPGAGEDEPGQKRKVFLGRGRKPT